MPSAPHHHPDRADTGAGTTTCSCPHAHPPGRRRGRSFLLAAVAALVLLPAAALAADRFGDDVPPAHQAGVGWVADTGVTAGCRDGSDYCPRDAVTRDQMATFMHRLSGHASGVAPSVDAATVAGRTPDQLQGQRGEQGPAGPQGEPGEVDTDELEDLIEAAVADAVADLEADNDALQVQVETLETLLHGVERDDDDFGRDTLVLSGMNVQIVSGSGESSARNGLGNLIVGYNETRPDGDTSADDRAGSHNLVVGREHHYPLWGGLVAGLHNTVSGGYASVTAGQQNTADGFTSSVSGGSRNTADDLTSSVSGGSQNTADGGGASVSGGSQNTASGYRASILGGQNNVVDGSRGYYPQP